MKQTLSATLLGNSAYPVYVEATLTKGLPSFQIVGLASSSIQESKERVKSALLSNDFTFPPLRITLNLSPSDIHKDGTQFDLAIALMIAVQKSSIDLNEWAIFGELGLDGRVKGTSNLFALLLSFATQFPHAKVMIPREMAKNLSHLDGLEIYPVDTLKEAIDFFSGTHTIQALTPTAIEHKHFALNAINYYYYDDHELDFNEVKGQEVAKRAALIAAAGGHNLLLEGNPGSGKSMIAKRLSSILPPLEQKELLEIAKLDALDGKKPKFQAIRPFRSPHHSSTQASIFGGGSQQAKIGEVGLAHLGILFFDELPHFSKQILESLREPLEDKKILISRVQSKTHYDTNFLFVAAMNPCPCGNLLSTQHMCRCNESEIKRYKNRLSDPFLDRIDLFVTMQESQTGDRASLSSQELREQVFDAFCLQKKRGQKALNGHLSDKDLFAVSNLDEEMQDLLDSAVKRYALSARGVTKTIKIARTIADLERCEKIARGHLLEALSFRRRSN